MSRRERTPQYNLNYVELFHLYFLTLTRQGGTKKKKKQEERWIEEKREKGVEEEREHGFLVAHKTMRTYGVNQAFRFGIWLHRKSRQIRFFPSRK